jgi:hypothetical protein
VDVPETTQLNESRARPAGSGGEEVQPVIQGPRFGGVVRAEYTVGVAGCGQRATYLVICPEDGSGCFAAAGRNDIR